MYCKNHHHEVHVRPPPAGLVDLQLAGEGDIRVVHHHKGGARLPQGHHVMPLQRNKAHALQQRVLRRRRRGPGGAAARQQAAGVPARLAVIVGWPRVRTGRGCGGRRRLQVTPARSGGHRQGCCSRCRVGIGALPPAPAAPAAPATPTGTAPHSPAAPARATSLKQQLSPAFRDRDAPGAALKAIAFSGTRNTTCALTCPPRAPQRRHLPPARPGLLPP